MPEGDPLGDLDCAQLDQWEEWLNRHSDQLTAMGMSFERTMAMTLRLNGVDHSHPTLFIAFMAAVVALAKVHDMSIEQLHRFVNKTFLAIEVLDEEGKPH